MKAQTQAGNNCSPHEDSQVLNNSLKTSSIRQSSPRRARAGPESRQCRTYQPTDLTIPQRETASDHRQGVQHRDTKPGTKHLRQPHKIQQSPIRVPQTSREQPKAIHLGFAMARQSCQDLKTEHKGEEEAFIEGQDTAPMRVDSGYKPVEKTHHHHRTKKNSKLKTQKADWTTANETGTKNILLSRLFSIFFARYNIFHKLIY